MFCEKCGKELKEEAKFCEGCGTAVVNTEEVSLAESKTEAAPVTTNIVNNYYQDKKDHISVFGWIARPLFLLIPFAGPLVYFIMLFVWANDKTKEVSFNNWAKAQLWLMLIFVVLIVVIVVGAFLIFGSGVFSAFSSGFGGAIAYS